MNGILEGVPSRCFDGIVPSVIATCGLDGEPNVTYLSQVHYLDADHVALSCQFFNKTRRNVEENPSASVVLYDPVTFDAFRMRLCYERSEVEGALFDRMAARIQVIASYSGMTGIFRLIAADVYRVLSIELVEGYLMPPDPLLDAGPVRLVEGPANELRGLQVVSDRIARARDMDELLCGSLQALDASLGFSHSMLLTCTADGSRLVLVASHGYGEESGGVGLEVEPGAGLIGTVAELRRVVRVCGMGAELRYGRAIRERAQDLGHGSELAPEVPLPGLAEAQAQLGLPLLAGERLVGVLVVESLDPLSFDEWDETFLQIVGNQIAAGIERTAAAAEASATSVVNGDGRPVRRFTFYKNDDCVFVDREYLVRNVPGRILWKLLTLHARDGRTEFTNRELRLDPWLGLPAIKDNLESRLILLRKRLAERCPEARLVPQGRGRFVLELDCVPELSERDTA